MCKLLLVAGVVAIAAIATPGQQSFLVEAQQPDGHWSAAQFGGSEHADLRVNALLLLAYLGNGTTARRGPYRDQVKNSVRWLRAQQDAHGRLLPRADPDWLFDHAIGTCALVEELRLTDRFPDPAINSVLQAVAALRVGIARARPHPSSELRLWATMTVRSLRAAWHEWPNSRVRTAAALDLLQCADELDTTLRQTPMPSNGTARDAAAVLLLAELEGDGDGVAVLPQWPEDPLADPLLTFYLAVTAWLRGGDAWRACQALLQQHVVSREVPRRPGGDEPPGSWTPVGDFGRENGRLGTTAAALLLMEIYYRHCRLQVARDG